MLEDKKEGILRIYVQNADGHMLCIPGDKFDQWAEGQKEIQKKEPREINGDVSSKDIYLLLNCKDTMTLVIQLLIE